MKNKDLLMLGIIMGIAFFFIGAMITSTFQGNDENLLPYKISSFIKLFGLGILTTSLIVGGIITDDINKNIKLIILIIGLVLLLVFTIAAQFIKWDVSTMDYNSFFSPTSGGQDSSGTAYERRPATPGFELIFAVIAIIMVVAYKKLKIKT